MLVPLTFDSYTTYSLNNPNTAPLIDTFGTLNATGGATARFDIGGGLLPVSLVGTRGYHAYAALDAAFSGRFASNPVAIDFLP